MKKTISIITTCVSLLTACQPSIPADYEPLKNERDSLKEIIESLNTRIESLKDSVRIYSYPADQRLNHIKSLMQDQEYETARKEIKELKTVFPKSVEAGQCDGLLSTITSIEEKQKAEQERIKALGFKALKATSTVKIDYNTVTFSNISIGKTFVFDDYGHKYFYRTADRGFKYITATMNVKSTSRNPRLPQCAVYKIVGDKMEYYDTFDTEFARWKDYGTYLGNYHDFGNDFAKTSSINFKIGLEANETLTTGPFAIVLKGENILERESRDYPNPPVIYRGQLSYPKTLTIENFSQDYTLIKMVNLK